MKKILALLALVLLNSEIAGAENISSAPQNIILQPGNSYQVDNLNIMCVAAEPLIPVVTTECQYYGGYDNERCLFEKKVYAFEDIQCVAECQHWNERSKRCYFATQCEFKAQQKIFIKTFCNKFDDFHNRCDEVQEKPVY